MFFPYKHYNVEMLYSDFDFQEVPKYSYSCFQ